MLDAPSNLDPQAAEVIARGCARPIKTKSGVWVRCGSRLKSRCESCAELYRGDWAAIARSGVFDGPVERYRFYLWTLRLPHLGRCIVCPRKARALLRSAVVGFGTVQMKAGCAAFR